MKTATRPALSALASALLLGLPAGSPSSPAEGPGTADIPLHEALGTAGDTARKSAGAAVIDVMFMVAPNALGRTGESRAGQRAWGQGRIDYVNAALEGSGLEVRVRLAAVEPLAPHSGCKWITQPTPAAMHCVMGDGNVRDRRLEHGADVVGTVVGGQGEQHLRARPRAALERAGDEPGRRRVLHGLGRQLPARHRHRDHPRARPHAGPQAQPRLLLPPRLPHRDAGVDRLPERALHPALLLVGPGHHLEALRDRAADRRREPQQRVVAVAVLGQRVAHPHRRGRVGARARARLRAGLRGGRRRRLRRPRPRVRRLPVPDQPRGPARDGARPGLDERGAAPRAGRLEARAGSVEGDRAGGAAIGRSGRAGREGARQPRRRLAAGARLRCRVLRAGLRGALRNARHPPPLRRRAARLRPPARAGAAGGRPPPRRGRGRARDHEPQRRADGLPPGRGHRPRRRPAQPHDRAGAPRAAAAERGRAPRAVGRARRRPEPPVAGVGPTTTSTASRGHTG